MSQKRQTSDFDKLGELRFTERNPRGNNAEWIEFACTKSEVDEIMLCIGLNMQRTDDKENPAGKLLADICREWRENQ